MVASLRHYHLSSDLYASLSCLNDSILSVLSRIRANVRIVADGENGIRVVIPKEGFHLGSFVDDCHYSEVVGVVPAPGDAERIVL